MPDPFSTKQICRTCSITNSHNPSTRVSFSATNCAAQHATMAIHNWQRIELILTDKPFEEAF
jgi:hypothetical protein